MFRATAKPTTPLIDILDAMSRQPGSIGVVDNGAIVGTINAQNVVEGLTRLSQQKLTMLVKMPL